MNIRDYTISHRCCWPLRPGHACQRAVRNAGDRCHVHEPRHSAPPRRVPPPAAVAHPTHYNVGTIEVIEVIEDWNLNFNEGNVIKYVARARHKGAHLEDLKKARQYLDFEIARVERGGQ